MKILTQKATLTCAHITGVISLNSSQRTVRIDGHPVIVKPDPVGRPIRGCINLGPSIKPCTATVNVNTGYSDFIKIGGHKVCLNTLKGVTDGTPPGAVNYKVKRQGQSFVSQQ